MPDDITRLLRNLQAGDKTAGDELIAMVYAELRSIAARYLRGERRIDHTLQTTALVHEAYIRLLGERRTFDWKDRTHFFAVSGQVMRHILVDHARTRSAQKRGAGAQVLPLDEVLVCSDDRLDQLLILDEQMDRLGMADPRVLEIVVMRFYAGLSVNEIAEVLKISARTVKRDWNYGRAWLRTELGNGGAVRAAAS